MREIPADLTNRIRKAFRLGNYFLADHAFTRMDQRRVSPHDLRQVVLLGEAIEYDPPNTRAPDAGVLFCGESPDQRTLHVKVIESVRNHRRYLVVTVYEPDPELWKPGFKIRKR